jgi:hypothetical protein
MVWTSCARRVVLRRAGRLGMARGSCDLIVPAGRTRAPRGVAGGARHHLTEMILRLSAWERRVTNLRAVLVDDWGVRTLSAPATALRATGVS